MRHVKTIELIKSKDGVSMAPSMDYALSTLRDGTYTVTIKRKPIKRSIPQNALMWMWFACISQETGMSQQDIHDTYCSMFLSTAKMAVNGRICHVVRGTSQISRDEFNEFLSKVQADAAEMGITLPSPEDKYFEEFYNEYNPE